MSDGFYKDIKWIKLRSKVRAQWKREGKPCAYCGHDLDHDEKGSVTVDHIINRRQRPDLAYEQSNLQVVHSTCNTKKASYVENNTKTRINDDGYPEGW